MPQISPANTAVGLTTDEPGATAGEPDKYYPAGQRTYARIVARDSIKGPAMVSVMKEDGCTKVQLTNDKEVYGAGLAQAIVDAAGEAGLDILSNEGIDKNSPNYRSLAQRAAAAGADCFAFSGITGNNAVQLYKDFAAALPGREALRAGRRVRERIRRPQERAASRPTWRRASSARPRRCRRPSFRRRARSSSRPTPTKYGDKSPDPYAIYGYEAMRLALDAIERSETGEKADVLKALFDTADRESVLGTYSIDDNGDTTLTDLALESVENGELKFEKVVKGVAALPSSEGDDGTARPAEGPAAFPHLTRRWSCAGRCCATGSCRRPTRRVGAVTV